MRLKAIHIYGYGRFNDFKLDNILDLQLLYGENEAGKSTIMSFIHSILFGFPNHQQSELRYEPKTYSSYGGKLILETDRFGEIVIERVKGKASGDVTVLLESGPVESADFLPRLLNGTDKTMYRSIFSFDLQGLQEIQRLKEEEIGKYLLAAGSIGTDGLLRAEQQIQKELDHLFKPGGRKPILNERLKNLRQQERQLKKAKQENAMYESLLAEIHEIKSRVEAARKSLDKKKTDLDELKGLLKRWPLIMEKKRIKERLPELESVEFPADGLNRLEKYNDRLLDISSSLQTVHQRIEMTEKEMIENTPFREFDQHKAEVFINEWPRQEQVLEEVSRLGHSIAEDRKKYDSILGELHLSEKSSDVQSLNLGIDMKARLKETLHQFFNDASRLKDLEERLDEDKKAVTQLEKTCDEIEGRFVNERTFKEWKSQYEEHASTAYIENEAKQLQKDVEDLEKMKKHREGVHQKKKKRTYMLSTASIFVFLMVFIWSFIFKQWPLVLAGTIGMAYSAYSFVRKNEGTDVDFIKESLNAKKDQLRKAEELLKNANGHIAFQYKEQQLLREQWKETFARLEEQKRRLKESADLYQRLRISAEIAENKLNGIKAELGLAGGFSNTKIEDAFSMLKDLQELGNEMKKKMAFKEKLRKAHAEWTGSLMSFVESLGKRVHGTDQALFFLQSTLKVEQEKQIVLKEIKQRRSDLEVNLLQLQNEESVIRTKIKKLFKTANADHEEHFHKKAQLYEEMNKLKERFTLLEGQLGTEETVPFQSQEELQGEISQLEELIEERSQLMEDDRDMLASLNQKVRFLEEGGTFTENLHLFRQMRSAFNEEARNWAKLAVAASLLDKVMHKYKEGRFPKVIQKAAEYFSFLTNHEYSKLHILADGNLVVERKDRILFTPAELSKGTGEQLYIAIRLGLVQVLKKEYPFPIIIDDGFVNFDQTRTKRMLELIKKISSDTQVLVFTCHEHIAGRFTEDRILHLHQKLPHANAAE